MQTLSLSATAWVGNTGLAEAVYADVMAEVAPGLDTEIVSSATSAEDGAITHALAVLPRDDAAIQRLVLFSSGVGCNAVRDAPVLAEAARQGSAIVQIEPYGHSRFSSPYTARHPDTRGTACMTEAYHRVLAHGLAPVFARRPVLGDVPIHQLGLSMGGGTVVDHNRRFAAAVGIGPGREKDIASTVLISPRLSLGSKYDWRLRALMAPGLRFLLWISGGRAEEALKARSPMPPMRARTPGLSADSVEAQRLERAMQGGLLPTDFPLPYLASVFAHDNAVDLALQAGARMGTLGFPRTLWALYSGDTECDPLRAAEIALLIGGEGTRVMAIGRHYPLIASPALPDFMRTLNAFFDGAPQASCPPLSRTAIAKILSQPPGGKAEPRHTPLPSKATPAWLVESVSREDGLEASIRLDPSQDPLLADHIFELGGKPLAIMPGVDFVTMAHHVSEMVVGAEGDLRLRAVENLHFLRAMLVAPGQTRDATLHVTTDPTEPKPRRAPRTQVVLKASAKNGTVNDYDTARLVFGPPVAVPADLSPKEMAALSTPATRTIPGTAIYHPRAYSNHGVMAMVDTFELGDTALPGAPWSFLRAKISPTVLSCETGRSFAGHPTLPLALDMVFQAVEVGRVAAHADDGKKLSGLEIPSTVRRLEYYRPPSPDDLNHLAALIIPTAADEYDFVIYAPSTGEVFARGQGFKTVSWDRWKNDEVQRPTASEFLILNPSASSRQ